MNVMVIGGGGREHAIVRKLKESPRIDTLYVLPGNGGMDGDAVCVPEIGAKDIPAIVDFAKSHAIGYAVVAPDDPLALGAVDALSAIGVPCFGPNAAAARIESSKVFAKDLMKKYGIPTAAYEVFTDLEAALSYVETCPLPTVIKADGLALGKGVIIAETLEEAKEALRSMMADKVFGDSGSRVVIEEFLTGPEVNYTAEVAQVCMDTIFLPTIRAMKAEGKPFKGCLYFGLMLTPKGPKVIEYNCRFGDPETQVVLPLLESDLLTVMEATTNGTLAETPVKWKAGHACCVVLASKGYPSHYDKGFPMTLPETGENEEIYIAGAKRTGDGTLVTNGGRVLGAVATADTLAQAIDAAYALAHRIHFENAYCRSDIGQRALKAMEEQ